MTHARRFLSPVTASLAAGVMVTAATLGGTLASDGRAEKTDRFAVVGDTLCEGETWPNLSQECLAWAQGSTTPGSVRFVTEATTDRDAQVTTLTKVSAKAGH